MILIELQRRCAQSWVEKKLDLCVKFDAYSFVEMISPSQLLKVVGERADTKYFNKEGIGFA
jgi:hypothetical protein